MKKLVLLFIALNCCSITGIAQKDLCNPLDNMVVTGNYGEIRPNHFHAGIDLRTHASKNLPIHSIQDGYISRMKISTYGYGKVLYITHPGGYVSVYAHQHHFSEKIEKYIRKKQTEQETFELEVFPTKDELPIKKGEIIGYTGNTGRSQGPHLHFEIRDEKTEAPINAYLYFDFIDTIAPAIESIYFFDTNDMNNLPLIQQQRIAGATKKINYKKTSVIEEELILADTFLLPECSGFAFSAFDQHINKSERDQIYTAEILVDGIPYYMHKFDSIEFDKSRYINCFTIIDKAYKSKKIQKCFVSKNEFLGIIKNIKNTGELFLKDELTHQIKLICSDTKGNKQIVTCYIKRKKNTEMQIPKKYKYDCLKELVFEEKDVKIIFPEKTFFNDFDLFCTSNEKAELSNMVSLQGNKSPLFMPYTLMIKPFNTKKVDSSKLCIIEIETGTYCGGKIENGFLVAHSTILGNFKIDCDTVPPIILKAKPKSGRIDFSVDDDFSGIDKFKFYINNQWQYSEYESKQNKISYIFDKNTPKKTFTYKLKVWDKQNNMTEYSGVMKM